MRKRVLSIALAIATTAITTHAMAEQQSEHVKSTNPPPKVELATYSELAKASYEQAEFAFKNGNYEKAREVFTYLRNRYPYSRYAALSELRIGDTYFESGDYASAVQQYRGFIRLYPNNPNVPYASFKIAQSFYKGMPSESIFILPPAYEIDRSKGELAEREIKFFLERYPDSEYQDEAKKILRVVQRRLADYELYVAKYYMTRENFLAGSWRLKYLLEHYPGVGLDDQALLLLARCNIELKDMKAAFDALQDLVQYHPKSQYYARAKEYLEKFAQ